MAERCVFKSRLKRSDSTAGSRSESGSEYETVGGGEGGDREHVPHFFGIGGDIDMCLPTPSYYW